MKEHYLSNVSGETLIHFKFVTDKIFDQLYHVFLKIFEYHLTFVRFLLLCNFNGTPIHSIPFIHCDLSFQNERNVVYFKTEKVCVTLREKGEILLYYR